MRHYEIVFMIDPDQSEKVVSVVSHYKDVVCASEGKMHRLEDWGRRNLAYPIRKFKKAHYILMNIEVSSNIVDDLENAFRFDNAIIRSIIIRVQGPITEVSPIMKIRQEEESNVVYDKKNISSSFIK